MFGRVRRMLAGKPAQIYIEEQELGQESIKGPSVEMSVSPPYPGFPKHEPLPPIVLDNAACPYCGVVQDPPPTRRKKCQDCKETIYTWTDQESRRKYLLTQQEHNRIAQQEWDSEWKSLNSQIIDGSQTEDWHTVKMAHFRQALMLFDKGGDHQLLAAESRKSELRYYRTFASYRKMGVSSVEISTAEEAACEECRTLHGKVFELDQAMGLMPIPVRTCRTWSEKNEHGGWCRCSYRPIIPSD